MFATIRFIIIVVGFRAFIYEVCIFFLVQVQGKLGEVMGNLFFKFGCTGIYFAISSFKHLDLPTL